MASTKLCEDIIATKNESFNEKLKRRCLNVEPSDALNRSYFQNTLLFVIELNRY